MTTKEHMNTTTDMPGLLRPVRAYWGQRFDDAARAGDQDGIDEALRELRACSRLVAAEVGGVAV
jgi:hypothetical protein